MVALSEGQVQVRDLVMGPGTVYSIQDDFNPWMRRVRASQTGDRAWAHGSWSGAEWMAEAVVPLRVLITADSVAGWLAAHQKLVAAFRPSHADVEMRFVAGGSEYLMWVRPRMVEPDAQTISTGMAYTRCALVALDPLVYSGVEQQVTLGLPQFSGGLTVPFTVPFVIGVTQSAGVVELTNAGTADVGLLLRIDGPVPEPSVTLLAPGGAQTLRINIDLQVGQWLDVDTKARTVLLGGVTSRRGQASGQWPLLPPGTHKIKFGAAGYNDQALLTARWRSAWW